MGIQDLLPWIRKVQKLMSPSPSIITTYRSRWAAKSIRNKKVAIDATLLTNAFHFGRQTVPALEGKGAIIGWYRLITSMRAEGVQPIAIWDERGTRQWKAAEARKRLADRALALGRRNHEDERLERLHALRYSLLEFESLSEVEKEVVRSHWASNAWTRYGPPKPVNDEATLSDVSSPVDSPTPTLTSTATSTDAGTAPSILPATAPPSLDAQSQDYLQDLSAKEGSSLEEIEESLEKVSSFLDSFGSVLDDYRKNDRPFTMRRAQRSKTEEEIIDAIDHIREFEVITGEELQGGIVEGPNKEERLKLQNGKKEEEANEEDNAIDEKIQELVPPDSFLESPRQTEFTKEEGRIIEAFLGVTPSEVLIPAAVSTRWLSRGEKTAYAKERREFEEAQAIMASVKDYVIEEQGVEDAVLDTTVEMDPSSLIENVDSLIERVPALRATYARRLDLPTRSDHQDCRDLLVRMGVPVIEAKIPYEAEGLASSLAKAGLVDYVGTEDSDVLAYEGPLLKNLSSESKALQYLSGRSLREATTLDSKQFLEFCILLGTDASPRIPMVGPVKAYKLVEQYGTIEAILNNEPKVREKLTNVDEFLSMVNAARNVFTDYPPIPEGLTLEQGVWSEEALDDWLEENHGFRFISESSNQVDQVEDLSRFEEVDHEEVEHQQGRHEEAGRGSDAPEIGWDEVDLAQQDERVRGERKG